MVEQSTNLNDFLVLIPCCLVLLLVVLAAVGVVLLTNAMKAPEPPSGEEAQGGETPP